MTADSLQQAADSLAGAPVVLAVTGAGISAESGIPTFRGSGGLWNGFRAEELATPQAFAANPDRVWSWYRWRQQFCAQSNPNEAHHALVTLEQRCPDFLLATQNVDGLHPRAGSRALIELHGCIDKSRCTKCGQVRELALEGDPIPHCPECGAMARPHILWFGETYWPGIIEDAVAHAQRAHVAIVIGTSGRVWPPIAIALKAQECGATLIEINPERSELTEHADIWLQGSASEWLPALVSASS